MFALFRWTFPALVLIAALSSPALGLTISLTEEFDGVEPPAAYATVTVVENGGDLDFTVTLGGLLGAGEDAHELYFNLDGVFTGLALTADNAPNSAYTLLTGPSVAGGAGSSFEYGVSFGNGGGPAGNGALTNATFTLSANEALSESDLLETSSTNGGIVAVFALHIQGTSTSPGSETVGGNVPEPLAASLLLIAGLGLAGRTRRAIR